MTVTAEKKLTLRQYAKQEGITIQTAYRRIWDGRVEAEQVLGRWLICAQQDGSPGDHSLATATA